MRSDYGLPRHLSALQKARSFYKPLLPPCLQEDGADKIKEAGPK